MAPPFDDARRSRRDVLRASGAALATGTAALGAGCRGLPPLGTNLEYGTVDVPAAGPPTYREWLPAPSTFPDESEIGDGYSVYTCAPSADAPTWANSGFPRSIVAVTADYVGLHLDDADAAVAAKSGTGEFAVLVGDVDLAAVRETLTRTSYERDGTHAGYDCYARPNLDRSLAVGPDALAFGTGPFARGYVETVADVDRGNAPRYHEVDADVDTLTTSAGARRWAWLWPGGVGDQSTGDGIREDTVGWGSSLGHDGDGAYFVETWVFPADFDLSEGRVKGALKGAHRSGMLEPGRASAVDVSVSGRVATVAMYLAADRVPEGLGVDEYAVPFTTWSAGHDAEADRLTVRHDAGDPVRADWLWLRAEGLNASVATAGDVGERIEPGEDVTVSTADVAADATVRLVYDVPEGSTSASLFSYDLP